MDVHLHKEVCVVGEHCSGIEAVLCERVCGLTTKANVGMSNDKYR